MLQPLPHWTRSLWQRGTSYDRRHLLNWQFAAPGDLTSPGPLEKPALFDAIPNKSCNHLFAEERADEWRCLVREADGLDLDSSRWSILAIPSADSCTAANYVHGL